MVRLYIVLVVAVSFSFTLACRGDREDREHECHNNGEVCISGSCKDPCGSGWRIVVDDPQQVCHDHGHCQEIHCKSECQCPKSQTCRTCHDNVHCRETFCCKSKNYSK